MYSYICDILYYVLVIKKGIPVLYSVCICIYLGCERRSLGKMIGNGVSTEAAVKNTFTLQCPYKVGDTVTHCTGLEREKRGIEKEERVCVCER